MQQPLYKATVGMGHHHVTNWPELGCVLRRQTARPEGGGQRCGRLPDASHDRFGAASSASFGPECSFALGAEQEATGRYGRLHASPSRAHRTCGTGESSWDEPESRTCRRGLELCRVCRLLSPGYRWHPGAGHVSCHLLAPMTQKWIRLRRIAEKFCPVPATYSQCTQALSGLALASALPHR